MKPEESLRFFLGANTPQGFVSRFDQLADAHDGWRMLILKGGPGSGKSTLIKTLAQHIREQYGPVEMIHCASDVDSCDAVIADTLKLSIADGTAPHVIEPKYPGAVESLVDLSVCWDADKLYACRDEIIALTGRCSRCHEYCCRFLAAAGSLCADTYRLALDSVNTQKLAGYCARLAEKELRPVQKERRAREKQRFLTAVTNKGIVAFTDTATQLCERIYLINDEHGAVSRLILCAMRKAALEAGYDVVSCYCPLAPFDKLEQLFVPALGLGFMTSNRFHAFEECVDVYRIVNSQRFTDNLKLKSAKKRMTFNRKAAAQMLGQAEELLREAKAVHDELEGYYTAAMDFEQLSELSDRLLARVDHMAQAHLAR